MRGSSSHIQHPPSPASPRTTYRQPPKSILPDLVMSVHPDLLSTRSLSTTTTAGADVPPTAAPTQAVAPSESTHISVEHEIPRASSASPSCYSFKIPFQPSPSLSRPLPSFQQASKSTLALATPSPGLPCFVSPFQQASTSTLSTPRSLSPF